MNVKELMHSATIVHGDLTVLEAAKLMRDRDVGSVIVEEGERDYHIVTERDILYKVVAEEKPYTIPISEIMCSDFHTINADDGIRRASELFNRFPIRRLPVIENGEIIGVITSRDVAKYTIFMFYEFLRSMIEDPRYEEIFCINVQKIMHDKNTVDPDATIVECAKTMFNKQVGSALVKHNQGWGILTERDILKKVVAMDADPRETLVKHVMTEHLVCIDSREGLCVASKMLNMYDVRNLPVMSPEGEIIGIVFSRDIAKYSVHAFDETVKALSKIDPESAKLLEAEKW
ncbi:MAG: CBS domain-containing protein [Euryarchaeota archaeon]|nr:CBS domain-containing protein [Euryarchaeota archaeon]